MIVTRIFSCSNNVFKTFFLRIFNPFPNKPWFLCVCRTDLLKTLWENKKLLVTSKISFLHRFFYPFGEFSAVFINFEIIDLNQYKNKYHLVKRSKFPCVILTLYPTILTFNDPEQEAF